jgi:hypothetical protein
MVDFLPPSQSIIKLRIPFLNQWALPYQLPTSADYLNTWGVFHKGDAFGEPVFDIDTIASIPYEHAQKLSSFPVEGGSFASYNKVNEPRKIRVKMAVHGGRRVGAFFDQLETELMSTNQYTIITPEQTYENMTLVKVPYKRDNKSVDMIQVECSFEEVVEVVTQTVAATIIPSAKKAKAIPKGPTVPCHTTAPPVKIDPPINPLAGHSF